MTLQPNYKKIFMVLGCTIALLFALAATIARVSDSRWWTAAEAARYLLVALVSPTFLLAVPRRIEWSETDFSISPRVGSPRTYSWSELVRYGPGEGKGVLVLRFADRRSFQIFTWAFDTSSWKLFTTFLARVHPEKRS
jgi:hypothetical protein